MKPAHTTSSTSRGRRASRARRTVAVVGRGETPRAARPPARRAPAPARRAASTRRDHARVARAGVNVSSSTCRFVPGAGDEHAEPQRVAGRSDAEHRPPTRTGRPGRADRRRSARPARRAPSAVSIAADRVAARDDDDVADAAVEDAAHLVALHARGRPAAEARPGSGQRPRRCARPAPAGSTRGRLPSMPPPVTCAMARTSTASTQRRHLGRVDARRREQVAGRVARRVVALEQAPDQREAVGVRAARGQADDRVADRDDARAVDDAVCARRSPTQKPARSMSSSAVHAGQLGGLAAEQRAAGLAAAVGDALDERRATRSGSRRPTAM